MAAFVICHLALPANAATLPALNLAWNPNPETDIASYELGYGTSSGSYPTKLNVGVDTTATVSGLSAQVTYYFVVTAINQAGQRSAPSAELSYSGTLPATNQAPNGTIGAPSADARITAGQTVSFAATGSDPDGDTALTYRWNFGSGSGLADSTAKTPGSRQFKTPGTYRVTLTVTDSKGLADPTPATRTITVAAPPTPTNKAPNGTISAPSADVRITAGQTVSFAATGSDPNGDTSLTYRWNFGSGSGLADSTAKTPGSRQFNTPGTYRVTLTVTDSKGLADPTPATRTITVAAAPAPPPTNKAPNGTISAPSADVRITAGQTVSFAATGSDPDGDTALTYRWNFGSGSGLADSTAKTPGSRQFKTPGTYRVTLTVTDSKGLADPTPATRTITVAAPPTPTNKAPNGKIRAPSTSGTIIAGQSVKFAAGGTDPDGNTPLTYRWTFGRGSGIASSTAKKPGARTFKKPGTYKVTLTVTDSKGLADPTPSTRTIKVIRPWNLVSSSTSTSK